MAPRLRTWVTVACGAQMGHDSLGGAGFLIADTEIQEAFPEKPTCGRVIDTEREL